MMTNRAVRGAEQERTTGGARRAAWRVALPLVALVAGGCGATTSTRTVDAGAATPPLPSCSLPHLPAAVARAGGPGGPAGAGLEGPAVTSLQGGGAEKSFGLDGGSLVVDRPRPGDRPTVSRVAAECAALASRNASNLALSQLALQGGIAIGYGRVSVRDSLLTRARSSAVSYGGSGGVRAPVLPEPTPYHDRLAWVAVLSWTAPASCPATPGATSPPISTSPATTATAGHGYQVFLLDAVNGTGALIYTEGRPVPCGGPGTEAPAVDVPIEQYSVPWTLVSRHADGHSATITARVLPCEGYDPQVLVPRHSDVVGVTALRPVNPVCGSTSEVTMTLGGATVTAPLPHQVAHAPTGPFLDLPQVGPTG